MNPADFTRFVINGRSAIEGVIWATRVLLVVASDSTMRPSSDLSVLDVILDAEAIAQAVHERVTSRRVVTIGGRGIGARETLDAIRSGADIALRAAGILAQGGTLDNGTQSTLTRSLQNLELTLPEVSH